MTCPQGESLLSTEQAPQKPARAIDRQIEIQSHQVNGLRKNSGGRPLRGLRRTSSLHGEFEEWMAQPPRSTGPKFQASKARAVLKVPAAQVRHEVHWRERAVQTFHPLIRPRRPYRRSPSPRQREPPRSYSGASLAVSRRAQSQV